MPGRGNDRLDEGIDVGALAVHKRNNRPVPGRVQRVGVVMLVVQHGPVGLGRIGSTGVETAADSLVRRRDVDHDEGHAEFGSQRPGMPPPVRVNSGNDAAGSTTDDVPTTSSRSARAAARWAPAMISGSSISPNQTTSGRARAPHAQWSGSRSKVFIYHGQWESKHFRQTAAAPKNPIA